MTTQEMRCTSPNEAAIAGNAVVTIVLSTTAKKIGSMIGGNTSRKSCR